MDNPLTPGQDVRRLAEDVAARCTHCRACVAGCAFLRQGRSPGAMAQDLLAGRTPANPFECNLCGLCGAVCPENLQPGELFLALRRQAVDQGTLDLRPYRALLTYERLGASPLLSFLGLPPGGDAVFFPGCALPGTRPAVTWDLFQRLRQGIPHLGVALDCCHKPSHDLGRQEYFQARFGRLREGLLAAGVRTVVTACPNCHKVFGLYGQGLRVRSTWEVLAEQPNAVPATPTGDSVVVHDPCALRHATGVQEAVRTLLRARGLEVAPMGHSGARTLCCGEGGGVGFLTPDLAHDWAKRRAKHAKGRTLVTYCAGCAAQLTRAGITVRHLGEVLLDSADTSAVSTPPMTYLNRLWLKARFWWTLRAGPRPPHASSFT